MNTQGRNFAIKTLSLSVACCLVAASAGLPARSEGDTISNTAVPLPNPSSTALVKKIWGTLDLRKLKSQSTEKKSAVAKASGKSSKGKGQTEELATKESTDTDTTSSTTATKKESAVAKSEPDVATQDTGWNSVPAKADSSAQPPVDAVVSRTENKVPTPSTNPQDNIDLATIHTPLPESSSTNGGAKLETKPAEDPSSTTKPAETSSASVETTPAKTETKEAPVASNTQPEGSDKPAFTVGNTGRITLASQVLSLPPGSVLGRTPQLQSEETQIVDSDEAEEVQETLKYEELATDESKTKVKAGAKFPIVLSSQLTSRTAKKGDPLQGHLKFDLKIGDRMIAKKGSVVNGHITYVLKARTIMRSLLSKERWYRNSGTLGLAFDEIVNEKGEHIPLNAQPARASRIVKNKAEGRELGVNHLGQVTGPWGPQLRHKAVRIGLNFALAPAGVFTFGAMPVALGVIGAVNPSFAFSKPVGLNVRHRRLKGFAWGFLSGVPGSWLIEDTTVKGQEAIIKPGDEFYAEFVDEFTGEQATDAQLMPGASTKLKGQVLTDPKKDKKKAPVKK